MMATTSLTAEQARAITDEVKGDARALWSKLLGLYEGGAHTALGYASWGAYCTTEFNVGYTAGYRMLDAARVVDQLPMGNSEAINERQARELARLPDPEARAEVWADVQAAATPEAPITAATVREAVTRHPSAPPSRAASVRAVPEPVADFPEDDGAPQWQCPGCDRWHDDDVSDCPDCQPTLWPDEPVTPTPITPPVDNPVARLRDEAKQHPSVTWFAALTKLHDFMKSARGAGGFAAMVGEWSPGARATSRGQLQGFVTEVQAWIDILDEAEATS